MISYCIITWDYLRVNTGLNVYFDITFPLNTEVAPETLERPTPVQTGESGEAEGLLIQAGLLEEDAKALMKDAESKRTLAYSMDPSLAPKKGPGRPKKTS